MNQTIIIPKNWNPNEPDGFNEWINKINNHVKTNKL